MPPTIPQPPAPAETARTLHEICEAARRGQCDHCSAMPGEPCAFSGTGPDGYHVARFTWARARDLISVLDVGAVLWTVAATPFTSLTVIYDAAPAGQDEAAPDPVTGSQPYDVYAKLEDPTGVLAIALAQWEGRDETRPQPEVRRAANKAMDAIDGMLRDLHAMRARLVGEIRAADDATAARVDALLAARQAAADITDGGQP